MPQQEGTPLSSKSRPTYNPNYGLALCANCAIRPREENIAYCSAKCAKEYDSMKTEKLVGRPMSVPPVPGDLRAPSTPTATYDSPTRNNESPSKSYIPPSSVFNRHTPKLPKLEDWFKFNTNFTVDSDAIPEGDVGSTKHPDAVTRNHPAALREDRVEPAHPSLPSVSGSVTKAKRRPPGRGKRGKFANATARSATDTSPSAASGNQDSGPDVPFQQFEDIGDSITIASDQPTNVTGHFCDLFVGIHVAKGKVALKRPRLGPEEYTSDDVRRFLREAETWRGLNHEFILPFIGTCRIGGYLYMVSPFIDNGTLSAYLNAHPEVDRSRLLYEAAEALAYLHRFGVIHGDIKATNILVSADIHALLCDFGLTKFATSSTSTALKSAGSLRWQSPELWEGKQSKTYESDTYAFGMTIAEVLTGRIPFEDLEQGGVILAVLNGKRPVAEPMFSPTGAPYYPTWRAAIHCWRKEPQKRLSMEQVAKMLKPQIRSVHTIAAGLQALKLTEPALAPEGFPSNTMSLPKHTLDNPNVSTRINDSGNNGDSRIETGKQLRGDEGDVDEEEVYDEGEEEDPYCYCQQDGPSDMVSCEGSGCKIDWFHLECLAMASEPDDSWLCLQCEQAAMP